MAPIPPQAELEQRINNLQVLLKEEDIDAAILPLGIYFEYYFGKGGNPSERIIAGIISRDSPPFILSPAFEVSNIERSTYIEDIVSWEETESPYKILAKELDDRAIGDQLMADPKLWIDEVEKITQKTHRQMFSGHRFLSNQRQVKTPWELEQLQAAAKASADGILAALPHLQEGMTEKQFVPILSRELGERSGNPLAFGIVQFGENSAIPHGMPTNKKLRPDSVVLIDAGTSVNGYQGDITITVPFGKPKGFEAIYQIVYEANRKALEADKPGISGSELDSIARDHIRVEGYAKNFTHRLGHGIGMEVHEEPYIVGTNTSGLKTHNCHTIEPGIYLPGKFGVRIEDDVMVTSDSAELLYDTPRKNFDVF